MMAQTARGLFAVLAFVIVASCAGDATIDPPSPPAVVSLQRVAPNTVLPQTVILVEGGGLVAGVKHTLVLRGTSAKGNIRQLIELKNAADNRAEFTMTFPEPGEYLIVCNEYCGISHHLMQARLIVEGGGA